VLADLFETPVERFREEILIEPPCRVNYGNNVTFKGSIYINMGLTILGEREREYPKRIHVLTAALFSCTLWLPLRCIDENKVTFGSRVLVAPNVTILTPTHPVDVDGRRQGTIQAFPVEVSAPSAALWVA
jgi:acetyltransferase-like isoleucine patch superfamily enzyme